MNSDDGALLLLRRATIIEREARLQTASKDDQHLAREISKELEGHPLALEQAGAHIEESASNLRDYLEAYRTQGVILLRERGKEFIDYPRSVVATLLLSYAKIEQANFGASEFLKFCAFLHPDNIPIKIFLLGSHILSSHLQNVTKDTFSLDNAIKEIRRYSFLRREDDIIGIHRLIQQVLRANMTREKQLDYLKFSITLLNLTFPSNIKFETWGDCEQLFPHVTNCAGLIRQFNLVHEEAAQLFNRTGYYLFVRASFSEAKLFFDHALSITRVIDPLNSSLIVDILNNQAEYYDAIGRYVEGQICAEEALNIQNEIVGVDYVTKAQTLYIIATLYERQSKYEAAETSYKQALSLLNDDDQIPEQKLHISKSLNALAQLYDLQSRWQEAESLYIRTLKIREDCLNEDDPKIAESLNNLALLYQHQNKYNEAHDLYIKSIKIYKRSPIPDHPDLAYTLNNLALLYAQLGYFTNSQKLYEESINILEERLGKFNTHLAQPLSNFAWLLYLKKEYNRAEVLYKQAIKISQESLGMKHPNLATQYNNLALLYHAIGEYKDADALYREAIVIGENVFGAEHLNLAEYYFDNVRLAIKGEMR